MTSPLFNLKPSFYSEFCAHVQAKTNGANVHKVNGLLGIVVNSTSSAIYNTDIGRIDNAIASLTAAKEALTEIKQITGVSP